MRSLSRIYRGGSQQNIRRMEYRDLEELGDSESGMFVPSAEAFEDSSDGNGDYSRKSASPASGSADADSGLSQEEVEAVREEAYNQGRQEGIQEGYSRGRQEGRQEVEQELDQTVQALASALEEINGLRSRILSRSKQDMVRLARVIAEQVIHVEASTRQEVVLKVVDRAIRSAVQSEEYRVRVNPGDMQVLTENKHLFLASISGLQDIVFESDEQIAAGGCVVESDQGKVDATLQTQLDKLQEQLMQEVAAEGE